MTLWLEKWFCNKNRLRKWPDIAKCLWKQRIADGAVNVAYGGISPDNVLKGSSDLGNLIKTMSNGSEGSGKIKSLINKNDKLA